MSRRQLLKEALEYGRHIEDESKSEITEPSIPRTRLTEAREHAEKVEKERKKLMQERTAMNTWAESLGYKAPNKIDKDYEESSGGKRKTRKIKPKNKRKTQTRIQNKRVKRNTKKS